jgi:hypothetical protein
MRREKAGFTPAFLFVAGRRAGLEGAPQLFCARKIILGARNFSVTLSYYGSAGWLDN